LSTYHITHTHSSENCFSGNDEIMSLWKQIENNAQNNNVEIKFFKVNPTEHIFFILLETDDYSNIEKTIGQCKKTADFTITPVIDSMPVAATSTVLILRSILDFRRVRSLARSLRLRAWKKAIASSIALLTFRPVERRS